MLTNFEGFIMIALFSTIHYALGLYIWVIIASAIFSWLYAFNIINTRNPMVASIGNVLHQVTEPVLAPIRRVLPDMGGVDISPIVVFIIIYFLQSLIATSIIPALV
jgi:YggT family protein